MPLEVRGTVEAQALLAAQIERMRRPGPALRASAEALDALIDGSIAAGQSPGGARWRRRKAATAPVTRDQRRRGVARRDVPYPLLQRTGALRGSVIVSSDETSIRLSIPLYYAKFHQFGTSRMPARPIAPFSAKGRPLRRGPAGDWIATFRLNLARYVLRGSV